MTDEEILKAQENVEYVLYDRDTGEIVQCGDMDMLAWEKFIPPSPELEKIIVPPEESWRLRGEFVDHKGDGKPMFKVVEGHLEIKPEHAEKVKELQSAGINETGGEA